MTDVSGDEGGLSVPAELCAGDNCGNARLLASEATPTPLTVLASFREGRSNSRKRAPFRPPSLDADDFLNLMNGSNLVKVELNRLEIEVRDKDRELGEAQAEIKVLKFSERLCEKAVEEVMVSAKEEPVVPIPPAMDGLLKVHKRIVDVDTDPAHVPPCAGGTVTTRMLVAATQGGSLIGKQGTTIKSIQDALNCTIRVLGGENLPVFALPDDSVVEVQGEPTGVHKAVELIATHLRKFLFHSLFHEIDISVF